MDSLKLKDKDCLDLVCNNVINKFLTINERILFYEYLKETNSLQLSMLILLSPSLEKIVITNHDNFLKTFKERLDANIKIILERDKNKKYTNIYS